MPIIRFFICLAALALFAYANDYGHFENGHREWKDQVGKSGLEVVQFIRKQDPSLKVILIDKVRLELHVSLPAYSIPLIDLFLLFLIKNTPLTKDLRFDRVWVFVDENGIVSRVPRTG